MIAEGSMDDMRAQLAPHTDLVVLVRTVEDVAKVKALVEGLEDVGEVLDLPPEKGRERVKISFMGDEDGIS